MCCCKGASSDVAAKPRVEPKLHAAPPLKARDAAAAPAEAQVDPVIDYVVEVSTPHPQDGSDLRRELLELSAGWRKTVLVTGYDTASGEWRPAANGSEFPQLRFALQMSNRAGCIDQAQLTAFRDAVLKWAETAQADAKCPDVTEAHAMAVELDRFCADVDIAIGVNVVSSDGNPFPGTKIRALAEAGGLKLEPEGVFYARNADGDTLFTLDNHEPMPFVPEQMKSLTTSGLTFLLDVPRVRGSAGGIRCHAGNRAGLRHYARRSAGRRQPRTAVGGGGRQDPQPAAHDPREDGGRPGSGRERARAAFVRLNGRTPIHRHARDQAACRDRAA
jgi:hypothetical protein